ncbi:MAG: hypothetical protein OJF60_000626 [Burkholderiaceae bacterium]|jgi:hypothetical protein|nr:MAG: hypothetical protein OJF60_000626 [Burkholderiaceae bacterium]
MSNLLQNPSFGKLIPGFDFLETLTKGATQSLPQMPSLGNWVAPTLNPDELEKRIEELKAVAFWLDQNAVALRATIQALEVQKMTLATLRSMDLRMAEVANAFTINPSKQAAADDGATGTPERAAEKAPTAEKASAKPAKVAAKSSDKAGDKADEKAPPGMVDPLKWWGALTQQFQQIATQAIQEAARQTPANALHGSSAVKSNGAATKKGASNAGKSGAAARKTSKKEEAPGR